MDATALLEKLKSGAATPAQLVTEAFSQIETKNPALNAATEILKDDAAQQLQALPDGPLKGLPVSIKECYAIKGKTIRSGSKRMKPIACPADAVVVQRLKAAGAIVVARGNTSEFLLGRETNNRIHGATNNVYDASLTSGGSSGGDGALVGSGCTAFGIGTDIGGSCRYPAVFNGIVGFKPASGQIDKTGIFPAAGTAFTESLNSPGVLCRSVRDARLVYNVIAGKQLQAAGNAPMSVYTATGFQLEIKDESIRNALTAAADFFNVRGSVQELAVPEAGLLYKHFITLMCEGFRDKIYEWSRTEDGKTLSYFGELFRRIGGNPTISDELFAMLPAFNLYKPSARKWEKTVAAVTALRAKYAALLGTNGVLLLPTVGILAPPHGKFFPQYNKPGVIGIITPVSFCNVLNLSCVTIPARKFQRDEKIHPPAIQLAAAAGSEGVLLETAELLEKALN